MPFYGYLHFCRHDCGFLSLFSTAIYGYHQSIFDFDFPQFRFQIGILEWLSRVLWAEKWGTRRSEGQTDNEEIIINLSCKSVLLFLRELNS